jgi:hypothetical protein
VSTWHSALQEIVSDGVSDELIGRDHAAISPV